MHVAPADVPILEDGRKWTARFYAQETQALWDQCTPSMQAFLKSKSDLDRFGAIVNSLGTESKIVEESVVQTRKGPLYKRTVIFDQNPEPFDVVIGFNAERRIEAFGVLPREKETEAPTAYLEYKTHTALRLPFDGEWSVAWGGRTVAQNAHASVKNQRFAYDFEVAREGSEHKGDGKTNADYWCFGEPIVAPGAGKVVGVVSNIDDNVPGTMNRKEIAGNHVVIDHGQGEFSFLAHLQKGSVRVKVGDEIAAGTPIGACGNSGNTSQPHLHYHLQNSPVLATGEGLPAQFRNYTANGKHVDSGEPVRKERISSEQR